MGREDMSPEENDEAASYGLVRTCVQPNQCDPAAEPTQGEPLRCRITELAVYGLATVAVVDVIAACVVSVVEGRPPLVLGDVAKVGMGALAGVALGTRRAHS